MTFGQGSVTMAYRPIAFEGTLTVSHIRLAVSFGPDGSIRDTGGVPVQPIPAGCLERSGEACRPHRRRAARPRRRTTSSTACRRSSCSTGPATASWKRLPHLSMGQTYDVARRGALRRSEHRRRPGPVRQRAPGSGQRVPQPVDPGGGQVTDIVVTRGLVKRYPGTLAVAGMDLNVGEGEIFGLVGPERRGQDDDPPDPGDPARPRRPATPRSPASTSGGTPTPPAASSASCRTCSGSTTT